MVARVYELRTAPEGMEFLEDGVVVGRLGVRVEQTCPAEFLGDLVSFKWGKAAEALFSLKRRRVALLEGELAAPGSEVAYIVKARETFVSE